MLCSQMVSAVVVPGLYEAEVNVADQSPANHKKALIRALEQMLVKLTGDQSVKGRPVTEAMVNQVEHYVQQYKYRNRPVFAENRLSLEEELSLWVSFNRQAVDRTLREYNVPVWGQVRPSTLIWLGVKDDNGRRLVGLEDPSGYTAAMDDAAQARGIVLSYPLLDETDTGAVNVVDIWGGFNRPVVSASERYQADAILSGRLEKISQDEWQGRYHAVIDGQTITQDFRSGDSDTVLRSAINWLADILADRYSQTSSYAGATGLDIEINGIRSFDQYSGVLKYLASLNSVINVEVKSVRPDNVLFTLQTTGGDVAVKRAIELGRVLESIGGSGNQYRLIAQSP